MRVIALLLLVGVWAAPPSFKVLGRQTLSTAQVKGVLPLRSPQVALVKGDHEVLAVFAGLRNGERGIYFRRFDEGAQHWSDLVRVSPPENKEDADPSLWLAPDGSLHCVWLARKTRREYQVFYATLRRGNPAWSAPVQFPAGRLNNPPRLIGDSKGRLYLYFWNRTGASKWGRILVYVSQDRGKTWRITDPNYRMDVKRGEASHPQLQASKNGRVHLVWLDQSRGGKGVVYNTSSDGGRTWLAAPVVISEDKRFSASIPKLFVSGENLFVLWTGLLLATPWKRTQIRWNWSRDGGKSWLGDHRLYDGPVTDVTVELFQMKDTVGCLWNERSRNDEGFIKEKLLWKKGLGALDRQPETLVSTSTGAHYEGLGTVFDGARVAAYFSEKRKLGPSSALLLVRDSKKNRWVRIDVSGEKPGFDARSPVAVLGSAESNYSVLFHQVRRRTFLREPMIWETKLIFSHIEVRK